jgi:molybdopterin biosynthesis enzyme
VSTIDPQDFGRVTGEVSALRRDVDLMRDDIKELLAAVENAKGGWRVLLAVGGVAGALGALVVKGWAFFGGVPK